MTTRFRHSILADVVCPPDPHALCAHCGDELQHHPVNDDPDAPITPDNAVCLDQAALAHRMVRYLRFKLADGQSLDCVHAVTDDICGVVLCPEHSVEFVSCAGNPAALHHHGCAEECGDCFDAHHADLLADIEIAYRKGGI